MSIMVVGLLLFGLTTQIGPWLLNPILSTGKDYDEKMEEYKELSARVARKDDLRKRYRALAGKTLSTDPVETGKELRKLLQKAATQSLGTKYTIDRAIQRKRHDKRTGMRYIAVTIPVSGDGPVKSVVNFLGAFYQLPYMVQVRSLTLMPNLNKKGGLTVKFRADVEALVLESNPLMGKDPVKTADLTLDPKTAPKVKRLKEETLAGYAGIWNTNIFLPQVAKAPPKPPTGGRKPTVRPKKVDKTRGEVFVVLVTRYPWYDPRTGDRVLIQEVLTRNDKNKEERLYRIGEKLDQGTLFYVDSTGAVVRTDKQEYYYYPAGKPLDQSERLDPQMHPDQYRAVQQLEATKG